MKKQIYLAAPLFNEMELQYNKSLCNELKNHFNVFLPQEDGLLLRDMLSNGIEENLALSKVFVTDIENLDKSDILLAILHGAHIDEGVAFELGYSYAKNKICIGLQEETRQALPIGNNPMISQSCQKIFNSKKDLFEWLVKEGL